MKIILFPSTPDCRGHWRFDKNPERFILEKEDVLSHKGPLWIKRWLIDAMEGDTPNLLLVVVGISEDDISTWQFYNMPPETPWKDVGFFCKFPEDACRENTSWNRKLFYDQLYMNIYELTAKEQQQVSLN